MTTVRDIYNYIDEIAPFASMEEWDNSGLLIGDMDKEVNRVVLCLDAVKSTVDFAIESKADLIITHHPIIFNAIKSVEKNSNVYKLISNDISVISAHTSYDKAQCGINDCLAAILGLTDTVRLDGGFVVAGRLSNPMSIDDFAELVAQALDCKGIRYTDSEKIIETVAVGGGACSEFVGVAMENADCFVTGDLKYHEMLDASEAGFPVISAGHFETENMPFLMLMDRLAEEFKDVEFTSANQTNSVMDI